jgi:IPT/TIG domain
MEMSAEDRGERPMKPTTAIAAALMSSPMLTGPALGGDDSASPGVTLCEGVADHLGRFCTGHHLSPRTQASCDQIQRSFDALCDEFDIVYASASAAGAAVDLLDEDYDVVPIEGAVPRFALSHVVIGPSDLDDPDVIALLRVAYDNGRTVAIANASQRDADDFHRLIRGGAGGASCTAGDSSMIKLYGLQKAISRRPEQNSSYCLASLDLDQEAAVRRWLRDRFTLTPPAPPTPDATSLGATNINDLVTQTHCSQLFTGAGNAAQIDVFVASLRDFDNQEDYYSVENPMQYTFNSGGSESFFYASTLGPNQTVDSSVPALPGTEIVFTEPDTVTSFVSSYTNSQSATVSGSVGFNAMGPNVSAGASVTIGESTTTNVPAVQILNQSDLSFAQPRWSFEVQNYTGGSLFAPLMDWLWIVPRSAYPDGGTGDGGIFFETTPFELGDLADSEYLKCNLSYPFPEWTVDAPIVSSVNPTTANAGGGKFSILGENFFPSIVSDVLLAGDALPAANFQKVDATEIEVTVPSGLASGAHPVQVNTFFNGQTLPSNSDVEVTITK